MLQSNCLACNKIVYHYPSRIKKYCSNVCARTGKANGNYKGENYSFISSAAPNYEGKSISKIYIRSSNGKFIYEHRAIAEKALGRKLKKTEVVHHINCDPTDNRNENLLIGNKAYHTWLHQKMGNLWAQERFGVKNA